MLDNVVLYLTFSLILILVAKLSHSFLVFKCYLKFGNPLKFIDVHSFTPFFEFIFKFIVFINFFFDFFLNFQLLNYCIASHSFLSFLNLM